MTNWGLLIVGMALLLGLRGPVTAPYRYSMGCLVVVSALLYAALQQHTF